MQQTFICSGPAFCVWAVRASSWAFCLGPFSRLCGSRRGLISSARPPLFLRLLPPRRQSYKCVSPLKTKINALNGLHHCHAIQNSQKFRNSPPSLCSLLRSSKYLGLLEDAAPHCKCTTRDSYCADSFGRGKVISC